MEIKSLNSNQTQEIASGLAPYLRGGEVITLRGDLGSGKTTFTQGLAVALAVKEPVTSPTFIFLNIYPISNNPTIKQICHIDAYRLNSIPDAISTGITDFLYEPTTLCIIEWPEKIEAILKKVKLEIDFFHIDEKSRLLKINWRNK